MIDKSEIEKLIENLEKTLGQQHDSVIISNKWLSHEAQDDYFVLNFSHHFLKILERHHNAKIEYELSLDDYNVKLDGVVKDKSFLYTVLNKADQIIDQFKRNKAELYLKRKGTH